MHPSKHDTANSGSTLKGFEFQKFSQTIELMARHVIVLQRYSWYCLIVVVNAIRTKHNLIIYYTGYIRYAFYRSYIDLMLGQQCRRWTSIKPGISGYLVYCCAALYIVYTALKEHNLLSILLFVNSIQNKVMALVPHILVTSN